MAEAVVAGFSVGEHKAGYNIDSEQRGISDLSSGECSQPSSPSVFGGGLDGLLLVLESDFVGMIRRNMTGKVRTGRTMGVRGNLYRNLW